MEPERATFRTVDELVDRLVAQAHVSVGELEPAGDLFRRPPARQHLGHVLPQPGILDQLAPALSALPGMIVGGDRIVPAILLHLAEQIAPDLAMDRRPVAAEFSRDPVDGDLGAEQAEDRATLLEGELAVGAGHGRTPRRKSLQNLWSCTWRWNPPAYTSSAIMCLMTRKSADMPDCTVILSGYMTVSTA